MQFFPQLYQFPIRKRRAARTIANDCWDGRSIRLADPAGAVTEWRLNFTELTDGELAALQQFFLNVQGRLTNFTFLDPSDNLVSWSEKLDEPVWEKDALLTVAGAVADPLGTFRAFRVSNGGSAALRIQQTLRAPAWFSYCFSMYARSSQTSQVSLLRGSDSALRELRPDWSRLAFSGQSQSTAESIQFGLEIEAGGSVDVFGMQVEAQTAASTYKQTFSTAGVYTNARLQDDTLAVTTVGLGRHSCVLNVIHGNNF